MKTPRTWRRDAVDPSIPHAGPRTWSRDAVDPPMRATECGRPFTSPDWIYEIKCDG